RDCRMPGKRRLHFQRGDVFAGAADDVLAPVDEMQAAVRTPAHAVAGMEPAVPPRFGRRRVVLEITGEEAVPRIGAGLAHEQLFRIWNDLQLKGGRRLANAARADMARLAARSHQPAAAGRGHRPGLDQWKAETRLEGGMVLG